MRQRQEIGEIMKNRTTLRRMSQPDVLQMVPTELSIVALLIKVVYQGRIVMRQHAYMTRIKSLLRKRVHASL